MTDLARFSCSATGVVTQLGTDDFFDALLSFVRHWVGVDEACVLLYPPGGGPAIAYREHPRCSQSPNLDTFITGPFLLDPFYVAASQKETFGFFSLSELAPQGFRSSEYYKTYYRFCGVFDETGYLIPLGDASFANISLAKTSPRRNFSRSSQRRLQDMTPLVATLTQRHFELLPSSGFPELQMLETDALRSRLELIMASFGGGCLTPRESEIVNAILHGNASKAIATQLGISLQTVKLHRKNAYRKLNVRNQSELFYRFIRALQESPVQVMPAKPNL